MKTASIYEELIKRFPNLYSIYSEEFLNSLPQTGLPEVDRLRTILVESGDDLDETRKFLNNLFAIGRDIDFFSKDTISRLKKRDFDSFLATVGELQAGATLKWLGFELKREPENHKGKKGDFLADDKYFIEVKSLFNNFAQENPIIDKIKRVLSKINGDFAYFVQVSSIGDFKEKWLMSKLLKHNESAEFDIRNDKGLGLRITIRKIDNKVAEPVYAISPFGGAINVDNPQRIRKTLKDAQVSEDKINIAIINDCLTFRIKEDSLKDALLGDLQVILDKDVPGIQGLKRNHEGFFGTVNNPKNTKFSGVIVIRSFIFATNNKNFMVLNPWSKKKVQPDFFSRGQAITFL